MWQLTAIAAALGILAGGFGAYKVTTWRCDAARVEAVEQYQQQVDELTARYRAQEQQILKTARVRREAFHALAADLSRNIVDCRISDDGLQDIRTTVRAAFPGAE